MFIVAVVQSLSHARLCNPMDCSTPSFPVFHYLPEFAQIHVPLMPSNHVILCHPLLLLPPIFPSIRVFPMNQFCALGSQNIGASASVSVLPVNSQDYFRIILKDSFRIDWFDLLQSKGLSRVFSNTTVQKHQFFGAQLSL